MKPARWLAAGPSGMKVFDPQFRRLELFLGPVTVDVVEIAAKEFYRVPERHARTVLRYAHELTIGGDETDVFGS